MAAILALVTAVYVAFLHPAASLGFAGHSLLHTIVAEYIPFIVLLFSLYMQLVGVSPKGSALPLDLWDAHFREVRIHGAFGRGTAFRRALRLMPALSVKRLVTARFPLARIEDAFAHAAAGRGVKTLVQPT